MKDDFFQFYTDNLYLHKRSFEKLTNGLAAQDDPEVQRKVLEFFIDLICLAYNVDDEMKNKLQRVLVSFLALNPKEKTSITDKIDLRLFPNLFNNVRNANSQILVDRKSFDLMSNVINRFVQTVFRE